MTPRVALVAIVAVVIVASVSRADEHRTLRAPDKFAKISDPASRSAALFIEAGKVLRHPRCLNCHPDGDRPSQGDGYPHQPAVQRGDDGHGISAMRCATCHQKANFDPAGIPGHPEWHLAPRSMGWQHKSLADICMQLKDASRNGGKTLNQIIEHAARDSLVGWAWKPGAGREPAPGSQASFGALMQAWADSGALCPAR